MKSLPSVLFRLACVAGIFVGAALAKDDRGLEVLIAGDAIPSPDGFRPKPGKPIHYVFLQTQQSLGDAVAGVKLPAPELVERLVVAELAKQGFTRTAVNGPEPKLIILAIVGAANFEEPRIPYRDPQLDPDFRPFLDMVNLRQVMQRNLMSLNVTSTTLSLEDLFADDRAATLDTVKIRDEVIEEARRLRERGSERQKDKPKIQALVGADKVVRALDSQAMTRADADRFVGATKENRLYITLTAYDAARWMKKERVLLWRTTMLVDWRSDFAKSLPEILADAGPVFGTDVAVPVFVDRRDQRKADVNIGELKVVPDKEPEPSASGK